MYEIHGCGMTTILNEMVCSVGGGGVHLLQAHMHFRLRHAPHETKDCLPSVGSFSVQLGFNVHTQSKLLYHTHVMVIHPSYQLGCLGQKVSSNPVGS